MKSLQMGLGRTYFDRKSTFQMNSQPGFEQDLASMRKLMERSVKFMSLSGLSGVLAGIYALAGVAIAYFRVLPSTGSMQVSEDVLGAPGVLSRLAVIALVVLTASLATGSG